MMITIPFILNYCIPLVVASYVVVALGNKTPADILVNI